MFVFKIAALLAGIARYHMLRSQSAEEDEVEEEEEEEAPIRLHN